MSTITLDRSTPKKIDADLKYYQGQIFNDAARFMVIVCGRRFGKTTTLLIKLFQQACKRPGLYGYFAPTYKQAKLIAWTILKVIVPPHYRLGRPNESELKIVLKNGAIIQLFGMDNAENLYGIKLAAGICDEYDQMKKDAVDNVLRPATSDTRGPLWYCGTPDATRGQIKDLFNQVQLDKKEGKRKDWGVWKFKSIDGGYIDADEIAAAKEELDERTYRQQYEATFETAEGKVYYAFDFDTHVQQSAEYDPKLPVRMFWDFNVDPFCIGFAQAHPVLNERREVKDFKVRVFDELVIRNSNTPEMLREFKKKAWFINHKTGLVVYGDASGNSRSTKSSLSDYQIIQDALKGVPGFDLRVKEANPDVKDRTACVNSKLKSFDGVVDMTINPRCKWLIKDLMDVTRKQGTNDIDKTNPDRTHSSDGLGYFIEYEYPIVKGFLH